jgi:hypothetical protein
MVGADGAVDLAEPAAAIGDAGLGGGEKNRGRRGSDSEFRRARRAGREKGDGTQEGGWRAAHR